MNSCAYIFFTTFCLFIFACSPLFSRIYLVFILKKDTVCFLRTALRNDICKKKSILHEKNIFFFTMDCFYICNTTYLQELYFFQRPFTRIELDGKIESYDALSVAYSFILYVINFYVFFSDKKTALF